MGISQDAMHIFIGVGFQILLALLFRVRLSHPLPWFGVLVFELANEWSDLHLDLWPDRAVQYGESLKDLGLTMAIPTALLLLVRFVPGLFTPAHELPSPPTDTLEMGDASRAMDAQ
ncbi:MAG: hypothetical protein ACXWUR_06870 [Allosphingosinicella sp.]